MFFPTQLSRSKLIPAKPRRAISSSLRSITFVLIAIAIAVLVKQASAAGPQSSAPYVQVQNSASPGFPDPTNQFATN